MVRTSKGSSDTSQRVGGLRACVAILDMVRFFTTTQILADIGSKRYDKKKNPAYISEESKN